MTSFANEMNYDPFQRGNMPFWKFFGSIIIMAAAISFPVMKIFENSFPSGIYVPIGTLLMLAIFVTIKRIGTILTGIILIVLPIAVLLWSYKISHLNINSTKFEEFSITLIIFGFLLGVVFQSNFARRYIYWALLLNGSIVLLYLLVNPDVAAGGRNVIADNNPIWVARCIIYSAIAGILMFYCRTSYRLLGLGIFLVSLIGIYMTGTRQALLACLTCFGIFWTFGSKSNRLAAVIIVFIIAINIFLVFDPNIGLNGSRVFAFSDASTNARVEVLRDSFAIIKEVPEGIGVGNYYFNSTILYPHNIFVEFILEWGFFYGTVLIVLILIGASQIFIHKDPYMMPFKLLLVSEILIASISGNIISPRILYGLIFFGLLLVFTKRTHNLTKS